MKKRILTFAALFASLFLLTSCFGGENPGPDPDPVVKDEYSVTFDSLGGTAVKYQSVKAGATAVKPTAPLYVNGEQIKEFLGWYDANGNLYDFSTPVNADITLTAKWSSKAGTLAGGENGKLYNFKYADAAYRELLCATLERWVIDKGISIPLYYTNGLVMYNERITTAVENYVAYMGYGATYG